MAMGAVLGLAAWGRTQEKINGASTTSTALPSMDTPASSAPTVPPVVKAPPVVAPPKIPTVD